MNDSRFVECGGKVRVADGDAALALHQARSAKEAPPSEAIAPSSLPSASVLHKTPWPHAPRHQLSVSGTYFVTAGVYHKEHHFRGADRLRVLHRGLLITARDFGWQLEAWAVFSNHYHFIAHSPASEDGAQGLSKMLGLLHEKTAKWLNRLDHAPGRQVWHNFRETQLTLTRLNYVHQNPVKHGLVPVASQYPWCSASWFERTARPAQIQTIYGFKTNQLRVYDEYEVAPEW